MGGSLGRLVRARKATRWLIKRLPFRHGFSSLTRRIVVLNLLGLAILVSGICLVAECFVFFKVAQQHHHSGTSHFTACYH